MDVRRETEQRSLDSPGLSATASGADDPARGSGNQLDRPPPSAPASWQAAIDSGSIAQIRSWYVAHTGHDAEGACPDASTFETLVGVQNITKANTTLENVRIVGPVNVQATGFTLRCAIIDIGGYTYGVSLVSDSPTSGWTLEYVTFTNSKYLASKNPDSMANRPVYTNSAGTARYLKTLDGYGNGYYSVNASDQWWEYVFNDRVVKTPGSHNTGLEYSKLRCHVQAPSTISPCAARSFWMARALRWRCTPTPAAHTATSRSIRTSSTCRMRQMPPTACTRAPTEATHQRCQIFGSPATSLVKALRRSVGTAAPTPGLGPPSGAATASSTGPSPRSAFESEAPRVWCETPRDR